MLYLIKKHTHTHTHINKFIDLRDKNVKIPLESIMILLLIKL